MPSMDLKPYLAGLTPVNTNEYSGNEISSTQNAEDLRLSITKTEGTFDQTSIRLYIDPAFYNTLIHPDGSLIITDFRVIFHLTGSEDTPSGSNGAFFAADSPAGEPDVYVHADGLPEFSYAPASTGEIQLAGTYASSSSIDEAYIEFYSSVYGSDPVTFELEIVAFTIEAPEPSIPDDFWTNRHLTRELPL